MSLKRIFNLKIILPVLVLGLGVVALTAFIKSRPAAKKKAKTVAGAWVQVIPVQKTDPQIQIVTHGVVRASRQVVLSSRISGTVKSLHPQFKQGAFFKKGEVLLTLDAINVSGLNYTLIQAPFDGMLQQVKAEIGQYVAPGTPLLTLIGSQNAEIYADLPMRQLSWLSAFNVRKTLEISAQISFDSGNKKHIRPATVQRYLASLTDQSLMTRLILDIKDPFALNASSSSPYPPLFLGDFVEVIIPAKRFTKVVVLPAYALRANHTVWIASKNTLEIRPVKVVYMEQEQVFVSQGLKSGELLITSPLKGAANGLKIQIAQKEGKKGSKQALGGKTEKRRKKSKDV